MPERRGRVASWLFAAWYFASGGFSRGVLRALADQTLEPGWTLNVWTGALKGTFKGFPVTLLELDRKFDLPSSAIFLEFAARENVDISAGRSSKGLALRTELEALRGRDGFQSLHVYNHAGLPRELWTGLPLQLYGKSGALLVVSRGLVGFEPRTLRPLLEALAQLAERGL